MTAVSLGHLAFPGVAWVRPRGALERLARPPDQVRSGSVNYATKEPLGLLADLMTK
jgi:hypothetical protein